jgi:tRNA A-37 threonylcarbamoyl transferase component Bud32
MNPPTSHHCPQCGQLIAGGVKGLCPNCLAMVAFAEDESSAPTLASGAGDPARPAGRVLLTPAVKYLGDYELLEEVARGGMGVVFKARQKSLNRIVAVKMILGGQLATEADVKRFRTEAEAAANLKHPNIVAIHETGEHEGKHYFSMDFVEGRNLAQALKDGPLPAHQAAALLKTLAEAVHYAHQRGTLHRDLKPQNVLLDAEGRPHITDFGLAKQMTAQSDLTQEGSVMGSPSYMPPEQATGRQAEVGPASDVYSPGAILYQMLTGKAPFVGATMVETLRQVIEKEAAAPSKLNDKVPSDLETICLKCLEKKPERRYASARALTEELNRFLNHEPILAKPASVARKAWVWLIKHPWVITGIFSAVLIGLVGLAFGLGEEVARLRWKLAHPKEAMPFRPGEFFSDPMWWFLFFEFFFLQMLPLERFRRHHAQGKVTRNQVARYALIGLAQIVLGLWVARQGIAKEVWIGRFSGNSVLWIAPMLTNVWFGIALLWHCASSRQMEFGGPAADEPPATRLVQLQFNRRTWLVVIGAAVMCALGLWLLEPSVRATVRGDGNQREALIALPFMTFGLMAVIVFLVAVLKSRGAGRTSYLPMLLFATIIFDVALFSKRSLGWEPRLLFMLVGAVAGVLAVRTGCVEGEPLRWGSLGSLWAALRSGASWKRAGKFAGGAALLLFLFYTVENWRGERAWAKEKARLEARGESVDWAGFLPKPVPDELNAERHPFQLQAVTNGIQWQHGYMLLKLRTGGMPDSLPVTLATIKKLPATPARARFAELEPSLLGQPPLDALFEGRALEDAFTSLARSAGVELKMDTTKMPFVLTNQSNGRGGFKRTGADYSRKQISPAAALDELCAAFALAPEREGTNRVFRLKPAVLSREELRVDLAKEAERLDQFVEAFRRPHRQIVVAPGTMPLEMFASRDFYHERTATQLLATRANLHFLNRAFDAARQDLDNLYRMIETEQPGPGLVPALMRSIYARLYARAVNGMIEEGGWTDDDLAKFQRQLTKVNLLQLHRQGMISERAVNVESIRLLGHPLEFPDISHSYHKVVALGFQVGKVKANQEYEGNRLLTWTMAAVPRGWVYQNLASSARTVRFHEACDPVTMRVDVARHASIEAEATEFRQMLSGPYNLVAQRAAPSFALVTSGVAGSQTQVHLTLVACALERHRLAHGTYPELLSALVPKFAEKLPHDLFDGQPPRYRRTSDGKFLLYSIGWNSRDDGGTLGGKPTWDNNTGDWVWGQGL